MKNLFNHHFWNSFEFSRYNLYPEESYNNLKILQDQNLLQVEWKTQGRDFLFEKMDFEKLPKGKNY